MAPPNHNLFAALRAAFPADLDRTAVETDQGSVACEKVVNCGGQWARQIGAKAGITVPLQPVKHQYIVTEKIEGLATDVGLSYSYMGQLQRGERNPTLDVVERIAKALGVKAIELFRER